jgi:hypothetical protein
MRPAFGTLEWGDKNNGVSLGEHLDDFDPEIRNGLRKGAPNAVDTAPDRHDTVPAVGDVSSLRVVSAKGEHPFDIVHVIGGEKLFRDGFQIGVVFHGVSACRRAAYGMVRTIRKRALPDIILA